MCTKRKVSLLLGILVVVMFPLGSGVFSNDNVVHAQVAEPNLQAGISFGDCVLGRNWPPGVEVTLWIDDPATPAPIDYETEGIVGTDSRIEFTQYDGSLDFDLEPGHIVTLTDGTTILSHTVLYIKITKVDFAANSVEGYADPWSEISVSVYTSGYENVVVQADEYGYWDTEDSFTFDLNTFNYIVTKRLGAENTETVFIWHMPVFNVDLFYDTVFSFTWLPGSIVKLTIDAPDVPGSENYTESSTVELRPDPPFANVKFDLRGNYYIEPGDIVTLSDGGVTISHVVEYLEVTSVDPDTNKIEGFADPGKDLFVTLGDPYWIDVAVQADTITGEWEVDFSGVADLVPGDWGSVSTSATWDYNHTMHSWIVPVPTIPLLDDFNRADGRIGSNWTGNKSKYRIKDNQLRVRSNDSNSDIYWYEEFGADQEAYFTFAKINETAAEQDLLLKSQSKRTWGDGVIEVLYDAPGHNVQVWTWEWPQGWVKYGDDMPVTFMVGDTFKARARADGIVEVYRNGELLDTRDVSTWSYYAEGGYIGLWFIGAENAMIDDFGGGTVP